MYFGGHVLAYPLIGSAELRALEPWNAAEFQEFIAKHREHLAPWLPWARALTDESGTRQWLQRYADTQAQDGGRIYGIWQDRADGSAAQKGVTGSREGGVGEGSAVDGMAAPREVTEGRRGGVGDGEAGGGDGGHGGAGGSEAAGGSAVQGKELVGGTLFRVFEPRLRGCEIGVWLAPEAQGQGLITAAAERMIAWAIGERGMNRVEWRATPANARSLAVAKRLGMTREGLLREAFPYNGVNLDVEVWAILASQWRSR
jgi:RimJ/RimL family protein N-acetyltransferase